MWMPKILSFRFSPFVRRILSSSCSALPVAVTILWHKTLFSRLPEATMCETPTLPVSKCAFKPCERLKMRFTFLIYCGCLVGWCEGRRASQLCSCSAVSSLKGHIRPSLYVCVRLRFYFVYYKINALSVILEHALVSTRNGCLTKNCP